MLNYACQMTGLDPSKDTILSIACFITNSTLDLIESNGCHAVIHHSRQQLDSMSEWCIHHHGASGLTQQCLDSTTTSEQASTGLLAYIKQHIPHSKTALLAGNSIHADKMFLTKSPWYQVLGYLHYRLFDVSACKEMVRRWCSDEILAGAPVKQLAHTAREDVLESIEEARYYKGLFERMVA